MTLVCTNERPFWWGPLITASWAAAVSFNNVLKRAAYYTGCCWLKLPSSAVLPAGGRRCPGTRGTTVYPYKVCRAYISSGDPSKPMKRIIVAFLSELGCRTSLASPDLEPKVNTVSFFSMRNGVNHIFKSFLHSFLMV